MLTRLIFILTLFASAFLSFSIQPILGKMMLPLVGGAASAWIVAMAFFQLALLGGYTLSHILRHVSPIKHGIVLCVIYAAGLMILPASFPEHITLSENQYLIGWDVFKLLLQAIALPFIALTATTSALLRMFSRTNDRTAQDPYYLFIASNTGSLIGLFIFPLWFERIFELRQLSQFWFIGYSAVIGGLIISLLLTWKNRAADASMDQSAQTVTPVSFKQMASWFCLAFVPCSLSMGVTALITTDMGSFPLFWTLPLGLYLLTFIFAFQQKPFFKLDDLNFWHVCAAGILFAMFIQGKFSYAINISDLIFSLLILLGLFFVICLSVHQTLATQRPATDRLTLYYLIIALGGAVAGLINAFIVPIIFNDAPEFIISVTLSLLLPMIWYKSLSNRLPRFCNIIFIGVLIVAIMVLAGNYYASPMLKLPHRYDLAITVIFMICMLILSFKPRYVALIAVCVTAYYMAPPPTGQNLLKYRNFFSASTVLEYPQNNRIIRALKHGNTLHGMVLLNPEQTDTVIDMSVGYYSHTGPIQDIYNIVKPKDVAILGLGTGQLACYKKDVAVTFYEIDPDMVTLAENYFPYLKECPVQNIIIGDGRLAFLKSNHLYDMLILDAFSSDGIPVHLLTREAMELYPQNLHKSGVMLFHISNRYLALASQIAATAHSLGFKAYHKGYVPDKKTAPFATSSEWVVVTTHDRFDKAFRDKDWDLVDPTKATPWTDQKSSLLSVLRSQKNQNPSHKNPNHTPTPRQQTHKDLD
jgi:spermidine synthase